MVCYFPIIPSKHWWSHRGRYNKVWMYYFFLISIISGKPRSFWRHQLGNGEPRLGTTVPRRCGSAFTTFSWTHFSLYFSYLLPLIVLFVLLTLTYCSNERKKEASCFVCLLWKAILTTKTKRTKRQKKYLLFFKVTSQTISLLTISLCSRSSKFNNSLKNKNTTTIKIRIQFPCFSKQSKKIHV